MAAPSKAQLLNDVYALLKKRYKLGPQDGRMSVLEAAIYGVCHEGSTRVCAEQALERYRNEFFDWNELRVSHRSEIRAILDGMPESEERALKIRRFLRQLFEKTYGFNLEALAKKPLKESTKSLQEFEAFKSDYVLATVIQLALGGHAIPIDAPIRRALERLGLADAQADTETIRSSLERAVPKNRGSEFGDLLEELAQDTCVAGEPDCGRCELRKICPTGQARLSAGKTGAKTAKPQPAPAVTAAPPAPGAAKKTSAPSAKPAPDSKAVAKPAAPPSAKAPAAKSVSKPAASASPAEVKKKPSKGR